jgi:hypothetical protein
MQTLGTGTYSAQAVVCGAELIKAYGSLREVDDATEALIEKVLAKIPHLPAESDSQAWVSP